MLLLCILMFFGQSYDQIVYIMLYYVMINMFVGIFWFIFITFIFVQLSCWPPSLPSHSSPSYSSYLPSLRGSICLDKWESCGTKEDSDVSEVAKGNSIHHSFCNTLFICYILFPFLTSLATKIKLPTRNIMKNNSLIDALLKY